MKDTVYLVIKKSGVDRMVKTRLPTLKPNERVIRVDVSVPDVAFSVPPVMSASLVANMEHVGVPKVEVTPVTPALPVERYEPEVETDIPVNTPCPASREYHGVPRYCRLPLGHSGPHKASSSAGPVEWASEPADDYDPAYDDVIDNRISSDRSPL